MSLSSTDEPRGVWGADVLGEAREVVIKIMRGPSMRGDQVRLQAALVVLGKDFIAELPDEQLLREIQRRIPAEAKGKNAS